MGRAVCDRSGYLIGPAPGHSYFQPCQPPRREAECLLSLRNEIMITLREVLGVRSSVNSYPRPAAGLLMIDGPAGLAWRLAPAGRFTFAAFSRCRGDPRTRH